MVVHGVVEQYQIQTQVTNNEDTSFGDCSGEMNFNGTNIKFTKDTSADEVILEINGPDGNSKITLPLNDFQF